MLNGVRSDHAIVINDGMPGPEIRAKLGDTIRVNVENLLGVPTTMHFHGMTQFRTPFMDGDEMVSNCPIQSGYSHTYEFVAHPAGTTFYHSHSGSQRVAGLTGPLIVEDDDEPFADAPDRLVFIQDWYNQVSTICELGRKFLALLTLARNIYLTPLCSSSSLSSNIEC